MDAEELDRLVRKGLDSYNRRDPEAMLDRWDPDCEWHPFFSAEVEGAEVKSQIGQLFELREGRLLRGWAYLTHEEARQAAGLAS